MAKGAGINNNEELSPQVIVRSSDFIRNPRAVIAAVTAATNNEPAHIKTWHSSFCSKSIIAIMLLSLFGFIFMKSRAVFALLVYQISGLFSLTVQSCFGLVKRLDRSCDNSTPHIMLIKLCYFLGAGLWLGVPYSIYSPHDMARMMPSGLSIGAFIGFIFFAITMGFLIIMPAIIVNEIIMFFKLGSFLGNSSSYGVLSPDVSDNAASVELGHSNSRPRSEIKEATTNPIVTKKVSNN